MVNYVNKPNIGLMVCRQQKTDGFHHVFAHSEIVDSSFVSSNTSEIGYSFPLRIYDNDDFTTNFDQKIVENFTRNISISFSPEDLFDYIYSILHSPDYRLRYKQFKN